MTVKITERKDCRACGGNLTSILDLGNQEIINFGQKERVKAPLHLAKCQVCHLVQLFHTVDQNYLFRQYFYRSGTNQTMQNHLRGIVEEVQKRVKLEEDDVVLDIGANDCTLLGFYPNNLIRYGFEPCADLVPEGANGASEVIFEFFTADSYFKNFPPKSFYQGRVPRQAKVVTAIAMFYDLDDPNAFLQDIKKVLAPDGLFIIEQNYLPTMLKNNAVDNICVKPETLILGDNKPISELNSGMAFGKTGVLSPVIRGMKRDFHGNMVSIDAMYLDRVETTPEHPILVVKRERVKFPSLQVKGKRDYTLEWVPANVVKRGDYLVIPKLKHGEDITKLDLSNFNRFGAAWRRGLTTLEINEAIAWLLGLYVAEGSTSGRKTNPQVVFSIHQREQNILERIQEVFEGLGYAAKAYKNRPLTQGMDVRVSCASLARALPTWCGKHAKQKRIPEFIMNASASVKTAFLRGLFQGDGYVKNNAIHFHSASKILIQQTQLLVASLGGMLGISFVKSYEREWRGKPIHSGDSWMLRGSSRALADIFGFNRNRPTKTHAIDVGDNLLVPVKDASLSRYDGLVYNIETGDSSYLVSNAVVHNCHEHLCYYSLVSLNQILWKHGLGIEDVSFSEVNGGVFRVYVRHTENLKPEDDGGGIPYTISSKVTRIFQEEIDLRLKTLKPYQDFANKVRENAYKLSSFILTRPAQGETVYVYGPSTRGATLMQLAGLADGGLVSGRKGITAIQAAVDRNPEKVGTKYLGIPVISEEQMRQNPPTYLLILPYSFISEFLQREKPILMSGGAFIIPCPEPWKLQGSPL